MNWDEPTIMELRRLWDEGLTLKQIGIRLRCSRNTISGKVFRLELPDRPESRNKIPLARRELIIAMIKDGASNRVIEREAKTDYRSVNRIREQFCLDLPEVFRKPLPACIVHVPYVPITRARTCQFPSWSHDERPKLKADFTPLVCDGPISYKSYCREHADLCCPKWRVREAA